MNFLKRLWSMTRLGEATLRVAERAMRRRIREEDEARRLRLGDTDGQIERAQAFAARLEGDVLIAYADPPITRPRGWFGK